MTLIVNVGFQDVSQEMCCYRSKITIVCLVVESNYQHLLKYCTEVQFF